MRRAPCSRPAVATRVRARAPRAGCLRACAALLACAAALLPIHAGAECECLWQGSFADVQAETDLVVAGRVVERKGNAVDVEIERRLRGEAWLDTVRVWMKTRDYCRPEAEEFPPQSRWVMALTRIREVPEDGFDPGTPNQSYGRVDDYYLSSCGGYWLSYSGEAVTGNLIDAPRWAREAEMQPVLIELIEAYVAGRADREALREAQREDPALTDLLLDTRAFLRGDDEVIERP
jgi:hypothetical protein